MPLVTPRALRAAERGRCGPGKNCGELQLAENPGQRPGVAAGLVDTHRLQLGRIEERRPPRDQEHDRCRPIAERADLSGKPVDTAERIARTATRARDNP